MMFPDGAHYDPDHLKPHLISGVEGSRSSTSLIDICNFPTYSCSFGCRSPQTISLSVFSPAIRYPIAAGTVLGWELAQSHAGLTNLQRGPGRDFPSASLPPGIIIGALGSPTFLKALTMDLVHDPMVRDYTKQIPPAETEGRYANDATRFVVCWGVMRPALHGYVQSLVAVLKHNPLWCFGVNSDNSPKHPLYLRNDEPLVVWCL